MAKQILNPDFVIAAIYMAAIFTSRNLEHIASVEWRDTDHLYPAVKQYIAEYDSYNFNLAWHELKKQFKLV